MGQSRSGTHFVDYLHTTRTHFAVRLALKQYTQHHYILSPKPMNTSESEHDNRAKVVYEPVRDVTEYDETRRLVTRRGIKVRNYNLLPDCTVVVCSIVP